MRTRTLINKLIDELNKRKIKDKKVDLFLHFLNEAVLHKDPLLFISNLIKYELRKKKR
jgi:hypothetical protein